MMFMNKKSIIPPVNDSMVCGGDAKMSASSGPPPKRSISLMLGKLSRDLHGVTANAPR